MNVVELPISSTDSELVSLEQAGMTPGLLESGAFSLLSPQLFMGEPASGDIDQSAAELATQTIRYEAEDLNLNGYIAETVEGSQASGGQQISLKNTGNQSGTATGVFEGNSGTYNVIVGYYDENDGVSSATVTIDGDPQTFAFDRDLPSDWALPAAQTNRITHEGINLTSGTPFEINATLGGGEYARFDYIEFSPVDTPEPTPPEPTLPGPPPTPPEPETDSTLTEAGISQRATDYLNNVIDPEQTDAIFADPAFVNTLNAIRSSDTVPKGTTEITNVGQLSNIESGGTYVIRGDLELTENINVPNNVTIYVDGTLRKDGAHVATDGLDENKGNDVDAFFRVDDASNVELIGVDNAQLIGNQRVTGVYIEGSEDIIIRGFDVGNVWEGIVAHEGNEDVDILNNYVHDVSKRALWTLGADRVNLVHNFIENANWDGIDFDARVEDNVAFENVVVGWTRSAGFVEEGAQNNYFASNIGIMAEFEFLNPDLADERFTFGWNDNGTTNPSVPRPTANNFFINNAMYRPSSYSRPKSGGAYAALRGPGPQGKGQTFFWGNRGNVGFTRGTPGDFDDAANNPRDTWYRAEWVDSVAPGQTKLNEFNTLFN